MATSTPPTAKTVAEQIADLHAVIDNMAVSLATMQGNQDQLTVAVNRLQSEKIVVGDDRHPQTSRDPAISAAHHGHKLLFPTYDGTEDPLPWLNRCEQFFRIQSTEEAGKVFLTVFYMTGDVAQWYALVERNHGTPDWAAFVKLVNQRFGPPLRDNVLGELIQLRRETTIADYQSRFLALVNRCTGLTEKQQIDIFTVGLRNPLKTDVELEQPATLDDAMALARAYENRLAMPVDMLVHTIARPHAGRTPPSTKVLALPAPATSSAAQGATPAAPRLRRLTPAEMAAKREKGECFNCLEKKSRAHLEVCPMKGLFLLELESVEPDELNNAQPLISLNAITGISAAEAMRLHVHLLDTVMEALVDSGSTHSFISLETASRLPYRKALELHAFLDTAKDDGIF
jgi:hypothetical protein